MSINPKFKELPKFEFGDDFNLGFIMFVKTIPFIILYMIIVAILMRIEPLLRLLLIPFEIFAIPILFINFFYKETMDSLFEFKIVKVVFNNIGDYFIALLKSLLLGIVFFIMWIVLVGIPAGSFTKNIFLADFYRRRVK